MSPECKLALRQIRRDLRKHDAQFTSIGTKLHDDIRALRNSRHHDPWAWETTLRRVHMSTTRTIANLPFIQLYHLALISPPHALWHFPHSQADTIPNRTKLIAHAMKNLLPMILR